MQIVAFPQLGLEREPESKELLRQAMRAGADVVGGMPHWEKNHEDAQKHIDFCMRLAVEHDADVDMHVDETDDGRWHSFDLLAMAATSYGWGERTTAGHCCAMAAWGDEHAARSIGRAAAAGLNVVTNPATNLVIQGRGDPEPRRRGLTRVKDLLAGGVNVAAGHDNLHDGFYPLGAGDQLMIAWLLVHAAQLTQRDELQHAFRAIGPAAARVLRLDDYGMAEGGRGDVLVLDAATSEEALRLQAARRWVIRRGHVVAETREEHVLVRDAGVR